MKKHTSTPSGSLVQGLPLPYLVLVDEVGAGEEQSASRHDERADHRVHEAHHQHQEESRVHLRINKTKTKIKQGEQRDSRKSLNTNSCIVACTDAYSGGANQAKGSDRGGGGGGGSVIRVGARQS